jgi:hypothetical protein
MKKFVVGLLLLGQILWVCHNGFVFSGEDKTLPAIENIEVQGCFGLFRVVYSNFIESMESVIEIACKVGGMSEGSVPVSKESGKREVLYFSAGSGVLSSIVFKMLDVRGYTDELLVENDIVIRVGILLSSLWLLGIFLWLMRLKYYYLRPRGSIDGIVVNVLGVEVRNPNCFLKRESFIEQLGFFICSILSLKTFSHKGVMFSSHRLMKFYTSCKSKISDTLFAKVFRDILVSYFKIIKTIAHRVEMFMQENSVFDTSRLNTNLKFHKQFFHYTLKTNLFEVKIYE